jgi:hypothetical protein
VTWRAFLLIAIAALAGCSDAAVDPITKITAPRVLAVVSEPSALRLDGEIELTAVTVDPGGPRDGVGAGATATDRPVTAVRMRACAPWKIIADPGRACAGPDALALTTDDRGRATVTTAALEAAFPAPPGQAPPPDPWRTALAAGIALRVPIIAEVDVDGETLIALRDIDVVDLAARTNPRVAEVRFDGVATSALHARQRYKLTVTVDPASLDEQPGATTAGAHEAVDFKFYSPTGELAEAGVGTANPDAATPESEPGAYLTGDPGATWLFVVATDETGGMGVSWVPLTVE